MPDETVQPSGDVPQTPPPASTPVPTATESAQPNRRIEDLQAQYRTDGQQASRDAAVRQALAHIDPKNDDAQQPYAEVVRRLHDALQRVLDSATSPSA